MTDASGDTLTVPPAALPQNTIVTLDSVPLPLAPPSGMQAILTAFTFGPSGTVFNTPVTVVFHYSAGDLPYGADPSTLHVDLFDSGSNSWTFVGGVADSVAQTVTVQLAHFSTYALLLNAPPATPTATPSATATPIIGANNAVGGVTSLDVRSSRRAVLTQGGEHRHASAILTVGILSTLATVSLVVGFCVRSRLRERLARDR